MNEPLSIGVDVGGTKIFAGAVGHDGSVTAEARVPSPSEPEQLAEAIGDAIRELLGEIDGLDVEAIGIALPGLVDRQGVLHATPNLGASDRGLNLVTALGAPLGNLIAAGRPDRPRLALENDANCAAFAEARSGAAEGASEVVVVSIGTGIGGGVVTNGALLRGDRSYAGEIGHMVVERDGLPCPCGRRGCWERYASGLGLAYLARNAIGDSTEGKMLELAGSSAALHGEHVAEAAREGDPQAVAVIEEYVRWIGLGLANLVELFDPELIVLGGGLVNSADVILEPVRRAFLEECRATQERHGDDIVLAKLGDHAACVGAGLLAFESERYA